MEALGHYRELDETAVVYVLDDKSAMLWAGSAEELRGLARAILAGPPRGPAIAAAARGALRALDATGAGQITARSGVGPDG